MLTLKLQSYGHLMRRVDSLEKTLMLGGIGGRRRRGHRWWDDWMASLTRWTWVWVNSGSCWWTGRPGILWFMGSQRVGHDWATELNWSNPEGIYVSLQTLFSWEQNKSTVVVVIQSLSHVQYSCLENSMDRGVWQATVHRVSKSWIFYLHF